MCQTQMDATLFSYLVVFLSFAISLEGKKYTPANSIWNDDESGNMWKSDDDGSNLGWTSKSFSKSILPEMNEVEWERETPKTEFWSNIRIYFWTIGTKILGSHQVDKYKNLTAHLPHHVRVKRENQRKYIVKCCGAQSCTDGTSGSYVRRQEDKVQKEKEESIVNELQYKKRRKKKKNPQANLGQLHAYGVFTDSGIQISCAGCPSGWPDMLTVYPDYEFGIPVTCSNCPNNWPGALNLLGVGGAPSWANQPADGNNFNRPVGGRNNFFAFDTGSNFGSGSAGGAGAIPLNGFGNSNGGGGGNMNPDYSAPGDYEEEYDTPSAGRNTRPKRMTTAQSDAQPAQESANPKMQDPIMTTLAPNDDDEEDYEEDEPEDPSKGISTKGAAAETTAPSSAAVTSAAKKAATTDKESEDGADDEEEEGAATKKSAADASTKKSADEATTKKTAADANTKAAAPTAAAKANADYFGQE